MKQTMLSSGIIYLLIGSLFTYMAIQNVNSNGFGFFTYLLIILATLDVGSGIRIIFYYFRTKSGYKK
ncbi:YdiK family protein [Bacillus smithii]|uniref:YdiK family protein n=1 Tax=Bacillus smithii TaxID=1479 RepID=UPI002E1FB332|nr:YdiK family protein [Bacillus smithii]